MSGVLSSSSRTTLSKLFPLQRDLIPDFSLMSLKISQVLLPKFLLRSNFLFVLNLKVKSVTAALPVKLNPSIFLSLRTSL